MHFHPVAELFPLMDKDELQKLADDIKANGLRIPISIDASNRIYDGRNRFLACQMADVIPKFQKHNHDATITEVVSLNLRRRHYTITELAQISVKLLPMLESEARRRQATKGRKEPPNLEALGKATEIAAKLTGISPSTVERMKEIATKAPELLNKINTEDLTLSEAHQLLKTKPLDVVDCLGVELNERLMSVFAQTSLIKDAVVELHKVEAAISKLMNDQVGVYLIPHQKQIEADINNLVATLKAGIPYAVCPLCGGDGCNNCQRVGWCSEEVYKRIPRG